jgi:predicted glycosyltransferase involved in capsule biosynthesis
MNWRRTRGQWGSLPVFTGGSEPFSRAAACNEAAKKAGRWQVAIFCDSDLLLGSESQIKASAYRAKRTRGYVVAYDTLHYLGRRWSAKVRKGATPDPAMAAETVGMTWGGVFAIHRSLWNATGGFDETFTNWGDEDGEFLSRVNELGRKDRVSGAVYHLDHQKVVGAP